MEASTMLQLPPATQGRGGDLFPDAWVSTHRGQRYRLFEDLVGGRVVLLNLMSIRGHGDFPVTSHLAQVAARLKDQLGGHVRFLSLTTDPAHDTAEALRAFAEQQGAMVDGWSFLTGPPSLMDLLAAHLFRIGHHGEQSDATARRLVRYGNATAGVWGACAADCSPDLLVERLGWVRSGPAAANTGATLRRAGPAAHWHAPS